MMELTRGMTKEEMMTMCDAMAWEITDEMTSEAYDGTEIYECVVMQEDFRGVHGVEVTFFDGVLDSLIFRPAWDL